MVQALRLVWVGVRISTGVLAVKNDFSGLTSFEISKMRNDIFIFLKNRRVEKNGEISRNLRFSLFFYPISFLGTNDGRGTKTRTLDTRFWRPLLYQLSYTPITFNIISRFTRLVKGVYKKSANSRVCVKMI